MKSEPGPLRSTAYLLLSLSEDPEQLLLVHPAGDGEDQVLGPVVGSVVGPHLVCSQAYI